MATTIHIPTPLLAAVQRRARALGISRNRLIVRAIERELQASSAWPQGFFDELRDVEPETAKAVDEMLKVIRRRRQSKPPPLL